VSYLFPYSKTPRHFEPEKLFPYLTAAGSNYQKVLKDASTRIRAKYDFYEMTLQIEEFHEDMDDCSHCQAPQQ
jgi:hypothetical protein